MATILATREEQERHDNRRERPNPQMGDRSERPTDSSFAEDRRRQRQRNVESQRKREWEAREMERELGQISNRLREEEAREMERELGQIRKRLLHLSGAGSRSRQRATSLDGGREKERSRQPYWERDDVAETLSLRVGQPPTQEFRREPLLRSRTDRMQDRMTSAGQTQPGLAVGRNDSTKTIPKISNAWTQTRSPQQISEPASSVYDIPEKDTPRAPEEVQQVESDLRNDPAQKDSPAERPERGVPIPGSYAESSHTHEEKRESLYKSFLRLSLGYKAVPWYNFKRFENLSLLSLYAYQHDLLMLDKRAFGDVSLKSEAVDLSDDDMKFMRGQLKDYHEALLLFKNISQLQRPSRKEVALTNTMLATATNEEHYLREHDAAAMLNLGLEALYFDKDKVRGWIKRMLRPSSLPSTSTLLKDESLAYSRSHDLPPGAPPNMGPPNLPGTGLLPPGQKRWILDNPTVDYLLRLFVGLIAGIPLLAPMVILCYVTRREYILITGCFSVLIFALLVSLVGGGATHEVMVAVATYAAVIVVFVGQTYFPGM